MKKNISKYTFLICGILGVFSCQKEEVDIVNTWKLVEVLADPGDGSGTFVSVDSDKIMVFHSDSTVTSNGTICNMSIETNEASAGTYSLANATISSSDCSFSPSFPITFEMEASTLIIHYPCFEGCSAKYVKQ